GPVPLVTAPGPPRSYSRVDLLGPLRPVHVPAVESVVRLDHLVVGVLHNHHVPDEGVVVEPGRRGLAVPGAAYVPQTDTAVAGVGRAEDARRAPVVAVQEGAGGGQAQRVRHVLDVVLAAEADGVTVH